MPRPRVLGVLDDMDKAGYHNNPTLIGDIRSDPTCLDDIRTNGIYAFLGGESNPTDITGSYVWSLRVYTSQDCSCLIHEAEKLATTNKRMIYIRHYVNDAWTDFTKDEIIEFDTIPSVNGTPTESTHVITKGYLDTALEGVAPTPYAVGDIAPENTNMLWIDTNESTGGLKYYNGTEWVHCPVAYT